jgi:PAS domain-containing protein
MATAARHLVLILAREFASRLAAPMLVADAEGNLVFYNEPAEDVLGRTYAEAGTMPASEWQELFDARDLDGNPLPLERMPGGIALLERRPAHGHLQLTGLDGEERVIAVTAFPLFARAEEFVGVVTLFWPPTDAEAS